jgi:hypothetical protein
LELNPFTGAKEGVLAATDHHPFRLDHMVAAEATAMMGFPIGLVHIFVAV